MHAVGVLTFALASLGLCRSAQPLDAKTNPKFFVPELIHRVLVTNADLLKDSTSFQPSDQSETPVAKARAFALAQYSLGDQEVMVTNAYTTESTGITHVYLRQVVEGQEVANADMNVNVDAQGTFLSYGSAFLEMGPDWQSQYGLNQALADDQIGPTQAVSVILEALDMEPLNEFVGVVTPHGPNAFMMSAVPGSLKDTTEVFRAMLINDQGKLEPVWQVTLRTAHDWVVGHVSRSAGTLVAMMSWKSKAAYSVYGMGQFDPQLSDRKVVQGASDRVASPYGWHGNHRNQVFFNTRGNNVIAFNDTYTDDWT
ncbi:hypothetical protein H4R34_005494 [Dimargaris verticillata]|uniref:Extracellular metalloproteinase n=1 Tax=Dimargaris verticillata TaxID=2761393 RepID=A0A9W8E648_9FUNG|nr:hypothetical protein H4R34_005494 [Dimargaris verticillata]